MKLLDGLVVCLGVLLLTGMLVAVEPSPTITVGVVNTLADGTYDGILLTPAHSGTQANPTVIRAARKYGAVIQPQWPLQCGVYSSDTDHLSWIIISGLIVENGFVDGIRFNQGSHIRIQDCWIRTNNHNGIAIFDGSYCEILRCLVQNNGFTEPGQAHGVYVSGSFIHIRQCRVWANAGFGIQYWPDAALCRILDNHVWDHAVYGGIVIGHQSYAKAPTASVACRIEGNTVAESEKGVQVAWGMYDIVKRNTITDCTYGVDLYNDAVAPVYLTENVNYATNEVVDLAEMAVITTQPAE